MRFKNYILGVISIFLVFAGLLSVISAVDSNNSSYDNTTILGVDPIPEPINNNTTTNISSGDGKFPLERTGFPLIGLLIILSSVCLAFKR